MIRTSNRFSAAFLFLGVLLMISSAQANDGTNENRNGESTTPEIRTATFGLG